MYNDFESPVSATCTREHVITSAKTTAVILKKTKFANIPLPKDPSKSSPLKYDIDDEVAYCPHEKQSEWIRTGRYSETIVGTIVDTVPEMGFYLIVNRDEQDIVVVDSTRIIKKTS